MPTIRPTSKSQFATQVLERLRKAGFEALWAGGCVRDLLLGYEIKDFDVATSARPDEVQRLFRRTLAIGVSFGVVKVLGSDGNEVEVATFRADEGYSDGRRPDSVRFASAREDAQRRDFTINGMFYCPIEREVFDYVGGRADLEAKILRAIGDPWSRFGEDKLRLLRAVRFTARLGFSLDPPTEQALKEMAFQIPVVSGERIHMELKGMLTPPTRSDALERLQRFGLLGPLAPEIALALADREAFERTLEVMRVWKNPVSFSLAVAGMVATLGEEVVVRVVDETMLRWKSSNEERERAVWLVRNRRVFDRPREQKLSTLKQTFAHPGAAELLDYHAAWRSLSDPPGAEHPDTVYCRELHQSLSPEECNPPALLSGHDLRELGLKPGPQFKQLLDQVREQQLEGNLATHDEALRFIQQVLSAS